MLKKIVSICAIVASASFALWDYFPILPSGSGQVVGGIVYNDQDPMTVFGAETGVRYSLTNWFELSMKLDYRFFTHFDGEDAKMDGLGNIPVGLRFQLTPGFGIFADVEIPVGDDSFSPDYLSYAFGLQHTSLLGIVAWGSAFGAELNTENSVIIFLLGNELDILLGQFVPYVGFNIYMGEDFGPQGEGANGFEIYPGLKFGVTPSLVLDFSVHFFGGDLFTVSYFGEDFDAPTVFSFNVFYTF